MTSDEKRARRAYRLLCIAEDVAIAVVTIAAIVFCLHGYLNGH